MFIGQDEEMSFASGALGGAVAGASVGGPIGAAVGGVAGGLIGFTSARRQNMNAKRAMQQAEKIRNQNIFREMMLRKQKDENMLAMLSRSKNTVNSQAGVNTSTGFLSGAMAQSTNSSPGSSGTF
jgi:predicted lipid-binding transport protein (Tim44 family)